MSTTFPRTKRSLRGYDVEQVEDFLEEARRAYGAEPGELTVVTAESIRRTAFALQKGGYSTGHVDAALERLEDAFFSREREQYLASRSEDEWYTVARGRAQEILDRLARPEGEKFTRTGRLATGYDAKEVDRFAEKVTDYFQRGGPLSVDEVRKVAFPSKRGGYHESQVDMLLDGVIGVMLAVR